jgi:hypothetical protein
MERRYFGTPDSLSNGKITSLEPLQYKAKREICERSACLVPFVPDALIPSSFVRLVVSVETSSGRQHDKPSQPTHSMRVLAQEKSGVEERVVRTLMTSSDEWRSELCTRICKGARRY